MLAKISAVFSTRQSTEHVEVINAGFYPDMQYGELQAIYSYQLNLKKPFPKKVFSRMGPCIEPIDLARSILLPAITVDGLEVPTSKLAWPCEI